jgi:phage terminase small subunit
MERIPLQPRLERPEVPRDRRHKFMTADLGPDAPKLTLREAKFVSEYLVDYHGGRAAKAAGLAHAAEASSRLLRDPRVLAEIHRQQLLNRQHLQLRREDLMQFWFTLAHADPRELIPVRVGSCRNCWGLDHQYQFSDAELQQLYLKHRAAHQKTPGGPPVMDEGGGGGFDFKRPPFSIENGQDHDCPECRGEGAEYRKCIDLDKLTPGARMLIGGFKIDRHGSVEIKFNDRLRAVEKLEEYCGIARPRRRIGVWFSDFDDMDNVQLDALLSAAKARGLLVDDDIQGMRDVTPRLEADESGLDVK